MPSAKYPKIIKTLTVTVIAAKDSMQYLSTL